MVLFGRRDGYEPKSDYTPSTLPSSAAQVPPWSADSLDDVPVFDRLLEIAVEGRAADRFNQDTEDAVPTRTLGSNIPLAAQKPLTLSDVPTPDRYAEWYASAAPGLVAQRGMPTPQEYARWHATVHADPRLHPASDPFAPVSEYGYMAAGVHSDEWVDHDPAATNRALVRLVVGAVGVLAVVAAFVALVAYSL